MKTIRFSVIGLNHNHIYNQVNILVRAGAEFVSFYAKEPELAAPFASKFPQAKQAGSIEEIVEAESIQLVVCTAIPCDRAEISIRAMRHGKDVMSDKPAFTTLEALAELRQVQAETGQIYSICYSERLSSKAMVKAGELVKAGAIGQVVQTTSYGPHRIRIDQRPDWFFQRERYGGIITDIGAHQCDQFLFFTGSTEAEVAASHVANYQYPQHPELEDFGEALLRGDQGTGHIRVDWYTPDGLPTWGDVRITILGTEGYLEVRRNCDIAGRTGGEHLFLVDRDKTRYIDCQDVHRPYGEQLIADILNRTETAMTHHHCFLASELALKAQAQAQRLGYLQPL